jgi:hypothetical protein
MLHSIVRVQKNLRGNTSDGRSDGRHGDSPKVTECLAASEYDHRPRFVGRGEVIEAYLSAL